MVVAIQLSRASYWNLQAEDNRREKRLQAKTQRVTGRLLAMAVNNPKVADPAINRAVAYLDAAVIDASKHAEIHTHDLLDGLGYRLPGRRQRLAMTAGVSGANDLRQAVGLDAVDMAEELRALLPRNIEAIAEAKKVTVPQARAESARQASQWAADRARRELEVVRRATPAATLRGQRIEKYRRALNGEACPFCTLIADRTYSTDVLMEAHDHCKCVVVPIPRGKEASDYSDPVSLQNARDVKVYRRKSAEKFKFKKGQTTRLEVVTNSKWGPQLGGEVAADWYDS